MAKAVIAIAKSEDQAVRIVEQLKAAGFSNNDVSVLLPDRAGSRDFAHEHHTKAPEGAATGAAAGGAVGGLAGALVGLGIPEYEAKQYEGKVKNGNILISVHTDDSKQRQKAK